MQLSLQFRHSRESLIAVLKCNCKKKKIKVRKRAKIRNRYSQASHLTQDTNGKVATSQLDNTPKTLNTTISKEGF